MDWSTKDIFKVIALYEQFECLWNFKSVEYKRVDKKKNAWQEISKSMDKEEEMVKKKIKNLRSAYLIEKKKVEASKKSGSSLDALYEPHLFYYSEMQFLSNAITQRNTSSNIPDSPEVIEFSPQTLQDDSEDSFATQSENGTPFLKKPQSLKRAKLENAEKLNNALDALTTQINNEAKESDSMFLTFGRLIGMQLAQLPLSVATNTMAEMQGILARKIQMSHNKDILQEAINLSNIL